MPNLILELRENEMIEANVLGRAKGGDVAAFEYLYRVYCKRVYAVCLRMVRNPAEAEDLTQNAFLQVFRKIGTFRGESRFATWLHRVTVNIVLMHLRRKKPTELFAEPWDPTDPNGSESRQLDSADTSMLGTIDRLNLMRAIRMLPSGYRRFVLLHDVIGYRHDEIAGLLGCSIGCSKSQLHKARKRLRQLMQGEQEPRESAVTPA
jgi:RNA polymerase sigma-70 factor (ECF subfamily)